MRLVSAIHVSLALIYTVHAIPVPASLAQEISNPPTVPGSGDRFTTLGDLPTPAALAPHLQRRNDDANPDGSDDDQGNQEGREELHYMLARAGFSDPSDNPS
ncbi:hypothetical protein C8R46DRAFT_1220670 [Mycena filopes]|nr:hypothetical protein C8R46DRAFT_1220670 [Mycena filopes]